MSDPEPVTMRAIGVMIFAAAVIGCVGWWAAISGIVEHEAVRAAVGTAVGIMEWGLAAFNVAKLPRSV